MYRTCLLAAALLLTGCSKADPFPIKIGTEAFLNFDGVWDLEHPPAGQTPMFVTKGTKVRIVDVHYWENPWKFEVLVLEGEHTGQILTVKKNHVLFAP